MNSASKKAILVVSFGTSYENTRKLTIEPSSTILPMHSRPVPPTVHGQAK